LTGITKGRPIFRLTFPAKEMICLNLQYYGFCIEGNDSRKIAAVRTLIYKDLNPHPAGQVKLIYRRTDGKSPECSINTGKRCFFSRAAGQTCHSYALSASGGPSCGIENLKFATNESE